VAKIVKTSFILLDFKGRNEVIAAKSSNFTQILNYSYSILVGKSKKSLILQKFCCTHLKMGKRNNH